MATETNKLFHCRPTSYFNVISLYICTTAIHTEWVILSFILTYLVIFLITFDNSEDWDATQLINRCGRVSLAPLLDNGCRRELVRSAVTCKNSINIIVFIIDLIFIYFVSDHGISWIMPSRCPLSVMTSSLSCGLCNVTAWKDIWAPPTPGLSAPPTVALVFPLWAGLFSVLPALSQHKVHQRKDHR